MNQLAAAISILTGLIAITTGLWKLFQRVNLVIKKVEDNTRLTDQTKTITTESGEKIKHDMEQQFMGLQLFHKERYRELNKNIHDAYTQIEGLKQRIRKLENDLRDHLDANKSID